MSSYVEELEKRVEQLQSENEKYAELKELFEGSFVAINIEDAEADAMINSWTTNPHDHMRMHIEDIASSIVDQIWKHEFEHLEFFQRTINHYIHKKFSDLNE